MTRRALNLIIGVSLLAYAGCCKSAKDESESTAPPTATAGSAKRFEGTYKSNWGQTTFTEVGSTVSARYPKGTMTCEAAGDTLTCEWFEGGARGKAVLTRQPNGDIQGTWGKGSSATDGGPWLFTKI